MRSRYLSAALTGALAAVWLGWGPATAASPAAERSAQAGRLDYDIPAQSLAAAVEAYAVASGIQVLYDRPVGAEPRSPGVRGSFTPQAALDQLLAGTGLLARFAGPRNVILEASPAAPAAGDPDGPPRGLASLDLGTVHVAAPPPIEPADRSIAEARLYGGLVKAYVTTALATDAKTSKEPYVAGISIWIDPSGALQKVVVFNSTGNKRIDAAICAVLGRLVLAERPPEHFPQPVNMQIRSIIQK